MIVGVLVQFFAAVQIKIFLKISDFIFGQKWRILGQKQPFLTFWVKNQNRAISLPNDRKSKINKGIFSYQYCKVQESKALPFFLFPDICPRYGHFLFLQIFDLNISKTAEWPYLGQMAENKNKRVPCFLVQKHESWPSMMPGRDKSYNTGTNGAWNFTAHQN